MDQGDEQAITLWGRLGGGLVAIVAAALAIVRTREAGQAALLKATIDRLSLLEQRSVERDREVNGLREQLVEAERKAFRLQCALDELGERHRLLEARYAELEKELAEERRRSAKLYEELVKLYRDGCAQLTG